MASEVEVSVIIALTGGVIAVATSAVSGILARSAKAGHIEFRVTTLSETPSTVARERLLARIEEAKNVLRKQLSSSEWSRRSANLLTIGQYIIGGLLASAFVQESLSAKLVGFLGVLVLLASLIKQHFRPEASAEIAIRRAAELKALVRATEDQLAVLDAKIASGQDHTDALISLLRSTTDRLTEIEAPDAEQRPLLADKTN